MHSIVKFLKDAMIIGDLNIEQLEDIITKILPATHGKEHQFYNEGKIDHLYEQYILLNKPEKLFEGDPKAYFYEF